MKINFTKILLALFLSIGLITFLNAQTTIILQPNAVDGKDASIWDYDPNENLGTYQNIDNEACSAGGTSFIKRNLFEFDLSQIPQNIIIVDAKLSLYFAPQLDGDGHTTLSGSNACLIQRVTSNWDEMTVTWNNQPSTTTFNEVFVHESSYNTEDYPNIDVTDLVVDILNDPNNSFGFMMRLQTEQKYRRLVFASSDHADSSKHPKLEICYIDNAGVEDINHKEDLFQIYPIPATDYINVEMSYQKDAIAVIYNCYGQIILCQDITTKQSQINISGYPGGIYTVMIKSGKSQQIKKIIKY